MTRGAVMLDLWDNLSATAQDILICLALLLPLACLGGLLLRGFRPYALVTALGRRFLWPNLMFVLLIAVSVGMSVALIAQERGLRAGMSAAADKFDLVIAAPGSELTMLLATVFLQPSNVGLLDGQTYAQISANPRVAFAAPIAFGDSYQNAPVVGTTAGFVRHLSDDRIEGRLWTTSNEAVLGAAVDVPLGAQITPAHGIGDAAEADAHADAHLTIVGRLPRTGTPWDRAILVPIETVWQLHGLADGHAPNTANPLGPPFDPAYFPGTPAVIVKPKGFAAAYALQSQFTRSDQAMAFFPGTVLANLYRIMGDVRAAMSVMSVVTQVLVAASVLLGLFILSRLFQKQLAMLRALGAPRRFVLAVIWSYGTALITVGTLLGLGLGVIAAAILSRIVTAQTDILVQASLAWPEVHLALAFVALTSLLSVLPALFVLRQPIVPTLRA